MWRSLLAHDLGGSTAARVLLALRGYGRRAFRAGEGTLPEKLVRFGFTRLEEVPGEELVFGIAGRFWRLDGDLRRIPDRAAFAAFEEPGCVKAAWNLRVAPSGPDACVLSTETRLESFGSAARRKFGLYWMLVGPFSGLTRRALLRGVAAGARGA